MGKKARRLLELKSAKRELLLFGPEAGRDQCPPEIAFHSLEDVFSQVDATPEGRWLIDRMLAVASG